MSIAASWQCRYGVDEWHQPSCDMSNNGQNYMDSLDPIKKGAESSDHTRDFIGRLLTLYLEINNLCDTVSRDI